MELSSEVQESLALTVDLSDAAFQALIEGALTTLVEHKEVDLQALPALQSANAAQAKECFAGICTVLLEAAKHDVPTKQLASSLEEGRLATSRAQYLAGRLDASRSALRTRLGALNIAFPTVVGLDWRLDYYVKSNALEKIDVPVYFVNLKVQQPDGSLGNVPFSASLQELQDLHAKLQDAAKQVERIYQKAE